MLRTTSIAALAALAGAVTPAAAQDFLSAQAPSHNIACQAESAGPDQPRPQLRCDIQQTSTRPPRPPASCPLELGNSFVLDPTGAGRLLCHGDTVADPSARVIPYGTQWRPYGFTCTSQTTGLTCVNGAGHGFTLSRAVQKAF